MLVEAWPVLAEAVANFLPSRRLARAPVWLRLLLIPFWLAAAFLIAAFIILFGVFVFGVTSAVIASVGS